MKGEEEEDGHRWVSAPPVKGSIVVRGENREGNQIRGEIIVLTLFIFKLNVALQLEMWSGGLLPPCWHRVVVPEGERDVSRETDIALFVFK